MNTLAVHPGAVRRAPALKGLPGIFRSALDTMTRGWMAGDVTFVTPDGRALRLRSDAGGPSAIIRIRNFRFIRRALMAGDIGFAEAYAAGEWETPDLTAVLSVFSLNFQNLTHVTEGNPFVGVLNFLGHVLNANSRKGSRRNIHAHYDLGNAFYSRWLDPSMTYSSARYQNGADSLEAAQKEKYGALARRMSLSADHHMLEIGCGWGGFAEFAAGEIGARVTGITISKEQHDFARRRMFEAGLAERADIQLIDYRDVTGVFDRVASIEMFEAVGEKYWPTYFQTVHDRLKPDGRAGLQIITIQDELFEGYRRRADFIQRYIFPGGMLISESRLRQETGRAGLAWSEPDRFGLDYAATLAIWKQRFGAAWDEIRRLGFDERFRSIWEFYLSYCEAGFRTGRTDVIQIGLARA
ncbi:MAG: class I SAM-dependent methyltransferase [Alphaproteobacteria bacterium]|uniref:class I SAM-dependent methyltransferase n=2 Tax=Phenylobacterium sp. TaxID=1871053 RepID=UPI00391F0F3E